jgi:hypothetical protein
MADDETMDIRRMGSSSHLESGPSFLEVARVTTGELPSVAPTTLEEGQSGEVTNVPGTDGPPASFGCTQKEILIITICTWAPASQVVPEFSGNLTAFVGCQHWLSARWLRHHSHRIGDHSRRNFMDSFSIKFNIWKLSSSGWSISRFIRTKESFDHMHGRLYNLDVDSKFCNRKVFPHYKSKAYTW